MRLIEGSLCALHKFVMEIYGFVYYIKYLSWHVFDVSDVPFSQYPIVRHGIYNQSCINYYSAFNSIWCIFTWSLYILQIKQQQYTTALRISERKRKKRAIERLGSRRRVYGRKIKLYVNTKRSLIYKKMRAINFGLTSDVKPSYDMHIQTRNSKGQIIFKRDWEKKGCERGCESVQCMRSKCQ